MNLAVSALSSTVPVQVTELIRDHYNDCTLLDVWKSDCTPRYDVYRAKLVNVDGEIKSPVIRYNDEYGAWFA